MAHPGPPLKPPLNIALKNNNRNYRKTILKFLVAGTAAINLLQVYLDKP